MTLLLSCACGKTLRVPDTAAGKPVRCPACGAVLTAPAIGEPEAVEPGGYGLAADATPTAAPAPTRERPVRWKSRRGAGRKRAQKQVYLGCGSLAILVGLGLLILTHTIDNEPSGKVIVAGALIAIFGGVSVVRVLTNTMPDDWKDLDSF
jgi:hypothetical protein